MFVLGASDAPVGANSSKQVDLSTPQRSTRAVPKAPTSQSASMSSDSTASATQAKGFFSLHVLGFINASSNHEFY